jgi:hypothetical protein
VCYDGAGKELGDYVAVTARMEAAETRAEAEQRRAEAAEERAARLAAKLRQLGIDPDNHNGSP